MVLHFFGRIYPLGVSGVFKYPNMNEVYIRMFENGRHYLFLRQENLLVGGGVFLPVLFCLYSNVFKISLIFSQLLISVSLHNVALYELPCD